MLLQMMSPVQGGLRQEKKFEAIANHLANSATNGFKADILSFDHLLRTAHTVDHRQGDLKVTGNQLDVAIAGKGFFSIQTENGVRYTRDGCFTLDSQQQLVTQSGDVVLGEGGPIRIEGADVHINEAGQVYVDGAQAGILKVVEFESPQKLKKEGGSLFSYTGDPSDEQTPEAISVKQGALEQPNISVVVEMTKMIETQRMYEAYQKMVQTFDEIDAKSIDQVGRLQ